MTTEIKAILFDMGGTLRRNIKRSDSEKAQIIQQIVDLLGSNSSAEGFAELLTEREQNYEEWASRSLDELNEINLWTQWMLPDWPEEKIGKIAMGLNRIWREAICTRKMFIETQPTIRRLQQNGYRIGLVSNTTSSIDAPLALKKEGIADCFEVIILSCVYGRRKPGSEILLEAVKRMNLLPEQVAYIGDRIDWDVTAARGAGIGKVIILRNSLKPHIDANLTEQMPDQFIDNLIELLDIFPNRNEYN